MPTLIVPVTKITQPMHLLYAYMLETDCDKDRIENIIKLQLEVNDNLLNMIESSNDSRLDMLANHQLERRKLIQTIRDNKKPFTHRILDWIFGDKLCLRP